MEKNFLLLLIILIFGLTTNGMARKVLENFIKNINK